MADRESDKYRRILVVARWPLGGIRTYMRHVLSRFPGHYRLTLLAASTHEDSALRKDVEEYGSRLLLVRGDDTRALALAVFRELLTKRYNMILSQGFISAIAVYPANLLFRIPHILTIHGIVEPRYFAGRLGWLKSALLERILSGVTVLYAVGHDILDHLYNRFPALKFAGPPAIVIPNGIKIGEEVNQRGNSQGLRRKLEIERNVFLFGFFGRFMRQKGFDLLIEAVDILRSKGISGAFAVLAVGSGDCLPGYRKTIRELNLDPYFYFLPFQPDVYRLYPEVDAVVVPSRWEASPLLPMEALCMGSPLIASDCIGLRETVQNTPAFVFSAENAGALARTLLDCMAGPKSEEFRLFARCAQERFDVTRSASRLLQVIEDLQERPRLGFGR